MFDVDQKLKIDDSTPLGTAFQANEKILLKGKEQSVLLDFDGSQSGLKKWLSSTEIVNNEPIDVSVYFFIFVFLIIIRI